MTTRITVRIPADQLARIDRLVAAGIYKSRSHAIRDGVHEAVGAPDDPIEDYWNAAAIQGESP